MCRCSPGCRWIKNLADLENGEAHFSIDMQVLTDLKKSPGCHGMLGRENPLILDILRILDILLQTNKGSRGTGPRTTGEMG